MRPSQTPLKTMKAATTQARLTLFIKGVRAQRRGGRPGAHWGLGRRYGGAARGGGGGGARSIKQAHGGAGLVGWKPPSASSIVHHGSTQLQVVLPNTVRAAAAHAVQSQPRISPDRVAAADDGMMTAL